MRPGLTSLIGLPRAEVCGASSIEAPTGPLRIVSDLAKLFFFSWLAVKVDAFFNIMRQLPALLIGPWVGFRTAL